MVKLIVSDIDGTLIPYGQSAFSPRLFPLIQRLLDRGVLFCPASGRQFHSVRLLFEPLASRLPILSENGAAVFGPGEREEDCPLLGAVSMDRTAAVEVARELMGDPRCHVCVSGVNRFYVTDPEDAESIRQSTGSFVTLVSEPDQVPGEILKVAAYCPGCDTEIYEKLRERWEGRCAIALSGVSWLDCTEADKGRGLEILCAAYGVELKDTVAFGDNNNDLPMLKKAGRAYVVESAAPEIKAQVPNTCADVCDILEEILRTL